MNTLLEYEKENNVLLKKLNSTEIGRELVKQIDKSEVCSYSVGSSKLFRPPSFFLRV